MIAPPKGRVVSVTTRNGTTVTGKVHGLKLGILTVGGQRIRAAAVTRWAPATVERAA